jgi:hypothetical protein
VIGIDFDNTIVCYDELFRRVAVEQSLVPPEVAISKTAIRDHLRASGREDRWTELQGTIYGPRMIDAHPFPGVVEFFQACREAGIPVAIISHRTRFPYLGAQHDLHAAARKWLERHGFHDPGRIGLSSDRVFFEETKEEKLARIAELGCTHFIDDLPELFSHPLFPAGVRRILFDPEGQHELPPGVDVSTSWPHLLTRLADKTMQLCDGGNNRVYRVQTCAGSVLLKEYFRHPADLRDRLGAEQEFLRFAWGHGVRCIPEPLACDRCAGIGLYRFIPGRKLRADEITAAHVDEAAAFFAALNRHRHAPEATLLPNASEACFSLAEHLACVEGRLARLAGIAPETELHRAAAALIATRIAPAWGRVRAAAVAAGKHMDAPLSPDERAISPSDFGFHNCIDTSSGLAFIDFEYAGWDDPAKTVCDFFCQPALPVTRRHLRRFTTAVAAATTAGEAFQDRVELLLPVYEIKWCCIMLNDFLSTGDDRRSFARADECHDARRRNQLAKVEAALMRIDS